MVEERGLGWGEGNKWRYVKFISYCFVLNFVRYGFKYVFSLCFLKILKVSMWYLLRKKIYILIKILFLSVFIIVMLILGIFFGYKL